MSPRARRWLATTLVAAVFLADRLAVLRSSGHLLFDLNNAEYGFFRALLPHLGSHWTDQLADPQARAVLLHDLRTVGNQVHGSLALFGIGLLAALQDLGAPLSTGTLRGASLTLSTSALTLWCLTLTRQTGRPLTALTVGALWVAAPMVLLELTMVAWGTHEVAIALHALLVALVAGHLGVPDRPVVGLARVAGFAALGAVLTLASYSLLMPVAVTVGWLGVAATVSAVRRHGALGAVALPVAAAVGLAAWAGTLDAVLGTGWLHGLGMPRALPTDRFLWLPGKQGGDFLQRATADPGAVSLWNDEVRDRAMVLVPGPTYGAAARTLEPLVRLGVLGLGAALGLRALRRPRRRSTPRRALSGYLGTTLVGGWVGVTVLSQTYGFEAGIAEHCPPRYYAHLFPVALAVLALWSTEGPRWRLAPAAAVVFFGAWSHAFTLDSDQLRAPPVYDGVRLWAHTAGPRDLPPLPDRTPFRGVSDAWLDGLALLTRLQYRDYWRWTRPDQVDGPRVALAVRDHLAKHHDRRADPDFWRGMGHALRVLVPPARADSLDAALEAAAPGRALVLEGYSDAPAVRME